MDQMEQQHAAERMQRQMQLDTYAKEAHEVKDRLGKTLDAGILDTVIALRACDIPTTQSCEGHIDHGHPAPWVHVRAPDEPPMIENEMDALTTIKTTYGIDVEQIKESQSQHIMDEFLHLVRDGQSDEWKAWMSKNMLLQKQVQDLLETYASKVGNDVAKQITIHSSTIGGDFRIVAGLEQYEILNAKQKNQNERDALTKHLVDLQQIMQDFGAFIKQEFLDGRI